MSSNDVASFLDTREKQKTFEDTIKRLSKNTQNGIQTTNKNFEDFCKEYYEKATEQVLEELKLFKGDELDQKTRSVIQNWINWQYEKGILTSTIKQRVSIIKRLLRFSRVKVHFEDFEEPLEFSAKIKEELYELTLQDIQTIFKLAKPKPQKIGFYLALISTGARPGELLRVRKKDIDKTGFVIFFDIMSVCRGFELHNCVPFFQIDGFLAISLPKSW